jgi:hypothetical protein
VVFPASVRALLALERTCPPLLRALERRLIAEFRRHRHASTAPDSQPTAAGR